MATSYLDDFGDDAFEALTQRGIKNGPNDVIPDLTEHYHFKPVFGLDYISLERSKFCFDNPAIPVEDYRELMLGCHKISLLSYGELQDAASVGNAYHFHEVEKHRLATHGLIDKFQSRLVGRTKRLPPVYQFALYTDMARGVAPRVLGFIGKWGIFYLLWFDWGHELYPRAIQATAGATQSAPSFVEKQGLRPDGKPWRKRIEKP